MSAPLPKSAIVSDINLLFLRKDHISCNVKRSILLILQHKDKMDPIVDVLQLLVYNTALFQC